ncbi:MAG: alpha/beta hydrolase [Cyanobacteriota bacterium]|nr:alpha/beta hydrolase [Cyanobacteriota bacterium]
MVNQRLLVVSNRSCHSNCSNEDLFGPGFNQAGPCELRVAQADFDERAQRWRLDLLPEDRSDPDRVCQASSALFADLVKAIGMGAGDAEPWVLFVPGYCSPCLEGLDKARQLQVSHGVNVILFSWPSDPREAVIDAHAAYRRTQEAAALSAVALDRVLSSLGRIFVEPAREASRSGRFKFSLLAHSLGNYLIQKLVQAAPIDGVNQFMFDNVILHQPDVDFQGCQSWIKTIRAEGHRYVTTNEFDGVLRIISDLVNPLRLGQATHHVGLGEEIIHVDFTNARNVNDQHWFFGSTIDNHIIQTFCTRVLRGELGEFALYADANEAGRFQAHAFDHFPHPLPR